MRAIYFLLFLGTVVMSARLAGHIALSRTGSSEIERNATMIAITAWIPLILVVMFFQAWRKKRALAKKTP
jgi:hypothetical protein